jgi:hypothetical protein
LRLVVVFEPLSSFAIARVVSLHPVHEVGNVFGLRSIATGQLKGSYSAPLSDLVQYQQSSMLRKSSSQANLKASRHLV